MIGKTDGERGRNILKLSRNGFTGSASLRHFDRLRNSAWSHRPGQNRGAIMIKQKAIVGLLVGLIAVSSGVFAGDLPENDVILHKDAAIEEQSTDAVDTRSVTEIGVPNEYEMEIMQEEILLVWSEMTLQEKIRTAAALGFWIVAWVLAVVLVSIGAPFFLYLAILAFYYANFTGAMAMGDIFL